MNYAGACYIYEISNRVNGKRYVGSTIGHPRLRWNTHKSRLRLGKHHSYKLQSAWNSFGQHAFDFKVLLICEKHQMLGYERELIKSASYNIAEDPSLNGLEARWKNHTKRVKVPVTAEAFAKRISDTWRDPVIKAKRIAGIKSTAATEQSKLNRSEASKGRKLSPTTIAKMATAKWKPLLCPELGICFLSQKYAAEYFDVLPTSIANAIKNNGKVGREKYSIYRIR